MDFRFFCWRMIFYFLLDNDDRMGIYVFLILYVYVESRVSFYSVLVDYFRGVIG